MDLQNARIELKFTTYGQLDVLHGHELTLEQAKPANERVYSAFYRSNLPDLRIYTCPEKLLQPFAPAPRNKTSQSLFHGGPVKVSRKITLYPEGVAVLSAGILLTGSWEPSEVNRFINSSLDGSVLWTLEGSQPTICANLMSRYFKVDEAIGVLNGRPYLESFSLISAESVSPHPIDSSGALSPAHEFAVYSAAIRRMRTIEEVRLDEMRRRQVNLSTYVDDLVYLNYHNLFTCIPSGRGHLPSVFYEDAADLIKVLAALLFLFDVETFSALRSLEKPPERLRHLRNQTEHLERRRLDILRALDTYRLLSGSSATRAQIFLTHCQDVFGIDPLQKSVEAKLQETEFILSARYSINLQRSLQFYSLLIGLISLIISIVGVVVAIQYG